LPAGLYGCETWSLTVREKHGVRMYENRVLRRVCGLKRNKIIEDWRKLHNVELYKMYS
jgi:hypothetical protein